MNANERSTWRRAYLFWGPIRTDGSFRSPVVSAGTRPGAPRLRVRENCSGADCVTVSALPVSPGASGGPGPLCSVPKRLPNQLLAFSSYQTGASWSEEAHGFGLKCSYCSRAFISRRARSSRAVTAKGLRSRTPAVQGSVRKARGGKSPPLTARAADYTSPGRRRTAAGPSGKGPSPTVHMGQSAYCLLIASLGSVSLRSSDGIMFAAPPLVRSAIHSHTRRPLALAKERTSA